MAAVFSFNESYGPTQTVTSVDTSYLNLLSADAASGSDTTTTTAANPITIPAASYAYSYERWLRGHWSGSFTTISAVYFWKYSGTLPGSVKIKALKKASAPTTYVAPVVTASTVCGTSGNEATATSDIPTATGTINPAYATNFSDYVVMQLVVPSGSASGSIGTMTYRMGWNEV